MNAVDLSLVPGGTIAAESGQGLPAGLPVDDGFAQVLGEGALLPSAEAPVGGLVPPRAAVMVVEPVADLPMAVMPPVVDLPVLVESASLGPAPVVAVPAELAPASVEDDGVESEDGVPVPDRLDPDEEPLEVPEEETASPVPAPILTFPAPLAPSVVQAPVAPVLPVAADVAQGPVVLPAAPPQRAASAALRNSAQFPTEAPDAPGALPSVLSGDDHAAQPSAAPPRASVDARVDLSGQADAAPPAPPVAVPSRTAAAYQSARTAFSAAPAATPPLQVFETAASVRPAAEPAEQPAPVPVPAPSMAEAASVEKTALPVDTKTPVSGAVDDARSLPLPPVQKAEPAERPEVLARPLSVPIASDEVDLSLNVAESFKDRPAVRSTLETVVTETVVALPQSSESVEIQGEVEAVTPPTPTPRLPVDPPQTETTSQAPGPVAILPRDATATPPARESLAKSLSENVVTLKAFEAATVRPVETAPISAETQRLLSALQGRAFDRPVGPTQVKVPVIASAEVAETPPLTAPVASSSTLVAPLAPPLDATEAQPLTTRAVPMPETAPAASQIKAETPTATKLGSAPGPAVLPAANPLAAEPPVPQVAAPNAMPSPTAPPRIKASPEPATGLPSDRPTPIARVPVEPGAVAVTPVFVPTAVASDPVTRPEASAPKVVREAGLEGNLKTAAAAPVPKETAPPGPMTPPSATGVALPASEPAPQLKPDVLVPQRAMTSEQTPPPPTPMAASPIAGQAELGAAQPPSTRAPATAPRPSLQLASAPFAQPPLPLSASQDATAVPPASSLPTASVAQADPGAAAVPVQSPPAVELAPVATASGPARPVSASARRASIREVERPREETPVVPSDTPQRDVVRPVTEVSAATSAPPEAARSVTPAFPTESAPLPGQVQAPEAAPVTAAAVPSTAVPIATPSSVPAQLLPVGQVQPTPTLQPSDSVQRAADTARDFAPRLAKRVLGTGTSRSEIVLEPAELGRLRFQLVTKGDQVEIHLAAERPETLDLMRAHATELRQEFRNAGLDTGSMNFSQWGQSAREDRGFTAQSGRNAPLDDSFGESFAPTSAATPSPRAASSAGLDLRL